MENYKAVEMSEMGGIHTAIRLTLINKTEENTNRLRIHLTYLVYDV